MIRIAAYLGAFAVIAGLLCLPAAWSGDAPGGRWDPVVGPSTAALLVVLAVGLVAAVLAGRRGERVGERAPAYVRTDLPPDGLGPAQTAHVLGEPVTTQVYVGTLLHAARLGAVELRREDRDWVLTAGGGTAPDDVTRQSYEPLLAEGTPFRLSASSAVAGEALTATLAGLRRSVGEWGVASGNMSRSGLTGGCAATAVLGTVLVLGCLLSPFGMSMLGVLPGALVVGAASAAFSGVGTRHTRRGRRLWARVGGLRQLLRAPSSRVRFDFAGRPDAYADLLPWAVSWGLTRPWAAKFRSEVGTEPPAPGYLGDYRGAHTADHVESAVHGLTSAVDGAIALAARRR